MTTVIKTQKNSNSGMWIALAISTVIAIAIAFYLNIAGKEDAASIAETPPAAAAIADAAPAPNAAPVVNR